ncbi:MAG: glycosyltransferase [Gemmatimonadaceae bacterium]
MAESYRLRVFFIIRSLDTGGAERQLVTLSRELAARGHAVAIATMYDGGALEAQLAPGVTHFPLHKAGRWDLLRFGRAASAAVAAFRPDILHGYMAGANEIAMALAVRHGGRVVWGVRVSDQPFTDYSRFRQRIFQIGCRLSHRADLIIANSSAGRRHHVAYGYPAARTIVIPNGIDTDRFTPDADAGARWRQQQGIALDTPLIVLPARLDPMKDHETFLAAAARVRDARPEVRFLAIGNGDAPAQAALAAAIADRQLSDQVRWLPADREVRAVYNAATLVTLTSAYGEGFPNVLGEAMACGVPCVATASGDSAEVLGDVGIVAPVRDHDALANGWLTQLAWSPAERAERSLAARRRMVDQFSVAALTTTTEQALRQVMHGGGR